MANAVIMSAVRTPIGTAYKGRLSNTTAEELARAVVRQAVQRAGIEAQALDDIILAESL